MFSEDNQTDPLEGFARTLSRFSPSPLELDRDQLMYLAGRASALTGDPAVVGRPPRTGSRAWLRPSLPAVVATTSLAVSMVLATALAFQAARPPTIVYRDRPVRERADAPPQPAELRRAMPDSWETLASNDAPLEGNGEYLKTRDVALRMGLDALGSPPYATESAKPPSYRDLWLGFSRAAGSSSEIPRRQTAM